jgi:hypothetical protein
VNLHISVVYMTTTSHINMELRLHCSLYRSS